MPEEQNFKEIFEENLKKRNELTDKQKRVLSASLELFSAQGFEATTTAQIAEKAGVSAGAVFQHFPTKQALLLAVMSPLFDSTAQLADEFVDATLKKPFETLDELIRAVLTDRMTYIYKNQREIRLLLGQLLTNAELLEQMKQLFSEKLALYVVPVLERFKKEGKVINLPTEMLIQLAFGPVFTYMGRLLLGIETLSLEEEIRVGSDFLLRGLRA